MLESRLAISSGGRERPTLSVQEMLSCSPYSQGCLGGFPYLVGKYLTDIGVASEACFPTDTEEVSATWHLSSHLRPLAVPEPPEGSAFGRLNLPATDAVQPSAR